MERNVIYIDTRQQAGKHEHKNEWFKLHDIPTKTVKLNFGDYQTGGSNISIDTKRNIDEIAQNISKDHARFRRECIRARDAGYRLIILIENTEGVLSVTSLRSWINGHCKACQHYRRKLCDPTDATKKCARHGKNKPIQGERLAKAMLTMASHYGVVFQFCTPDSAASQICCLLGVRYKSLCADCFRHDNGKCLPAYGMQLTNIGPAQPVDGHNKLCDWGCPF